MEENIGNNHTYLKYGVYMIVTVIDNSKIALLAVINRGHLVEKDRLNRGPFGGSFTLTPKEASDLELRYPGIIFKGDTAHHDKSDKDAKIYFPEYYRSMIDIPREELKTLLGTHQRVSDAFLTEFREEAFEEAFEDNNGEKYLPPLLGQDPKLILPEIRVESFAHTTLDYYRDEKYDKFKNCWYLKVSMSSSIFRQLIKSKMITILSHKDFGNGDTNGIPLTDAMKDGYKAAVDNGTISTGKKLYTWQ